MIELNQNVWVLYIDHFHLTITVYRALCNFHQLTGTHIGFIVFIKKEGSKTAPWALGLGEKLMSIVKEQADQSVIWSKWLRRSRGL